MRWRKSQPPQVIADIANDYMRAIKEKRTPGDCELDAYLEAKARGMRIGSGRRAAEYRLARCVKHRAGTRPKACPDCEQLQAFRNDPDMVHLTNSISEPIEAIEDEPEELLGASFDLIDQLDHPMIAR